MADVRFSPQALSDGGITPAYTGSLLTTNVHKFKNDGKTIVHVKKSGAGACTMTITTPKQVGGLDVAERTVTVAASTGDNMVGPFQPSIYNDGSGDVAITFSEVTGLTMAVVSL
jgi:hypothetical protein